MMRHNVNMIHFADVTCGKDCLMDGEIEGTRISRFMLEAEEEISFSICDRFARVLLVLSGEAAVQPARGILSLHERGSYVQAPLEEVCIRAQKKTLLLELCRNITGVEFQAYSQGALPLFTSYEKAPTYREDCKSEKTVSRMLIPARTIPRFAMGSVETTGDDQVEEHAHPMLEQFFLGVSDNNCTLMIDGVPYPFGPHTLLHIPLGSTHGVCSKGDQKIHYIWMDFLFDETGLAYMDQAHRMN